MTAGNQLSAYSRWLLLATPLLLLLDYGLGWNIRVAMIDEGRIWYYGALCVLAVGAYRQSAWLPLAALTESTVNIAGLIVGAWLNILAIQQQAADGATVQNALGLNWLINFFLVGIVQLLHFNRQIRQLARLPDDP